MRKHRRPTLGLTVFVIVAIAAVLIGQRFIVSAHTSTTLPTDMPKGAKYIPAGFEISKVRSHGEWVACHYDLNQKADLCRLTNQAGVVVFEGAFLPAGKDKPLPDSELAIATYDPNKHWLPGPIESFPVPVLPLQNGATLVPAEDSHAFAKRWKSNPQELEALTQPTK